MEKVLKDLEDGLKKTVDHMHGEFAGLQMGRASGSLVERVMVEVYGTMQPIKSIASISVPDAKTVQIQPWDRSTLAAIEKGIKLAEIGLNPQNDGIVIRLNVPPLTEERRRELAKIVSKLAEDAKIGVRNLRHVAMEEIKDMQKKALISEDQQKMAEKKIQEKVDSANNQIESGAKEKEADVMKV